MKTYQCQAIEILQVLNSVKAKAMLMRCIYFHCIIPGPPCSPWEEKGYELFSDPVPVMKPKTCQVSCGLQFPQGSFKALMLPCLVFWSTLHETSQILLLNPLWMRLLWLLRSPWKLCYSCYYCWHTGGSLLPRAAGIGFRVRGGMKEALRLSLITPVCRSSHRTAAENCMTPLQK